MLKKLIQPDLLFCILGFSSYCLIIFHFPFQFTFKMNTSHLTSLLNFLHPHPSPHFQMLTMSSISLKRRSIHQAELCFLLPPYLLLLLLLPQATPSPWALDPFFHLLKNLNLALLLSFHCTIRFFLFIVSFYQHKTCSISPIFKKESP